MLGTDSLEYEVFYDAVTHIKGIEGMTCEIGLRAGGGSDHIISALFKNKDFGRTHVMIDPYGNIEYETSEGLITTHDYTNRMRDNAIVDIYTKYMNTPINLLFFPLEDTEFFSRYHDGVPVYSNHKKILTKYALVHFDGPHAIKPLVTETMFFIPRLAEKAVFVYDDIGNYDHNAFEKEIMDLHPKMKTIFKGQRKAAYLLWN